jgi:hypothetical protein
MILEAALIAAMSYTRMTVPCYSAPVWMTSAKERRIEIVWADTDVDGDLWIRWELGKYWWQTLLLEKASILCIVGSNPQPPGEGLVRPDL